MAPLFSKVDFLQPSMHQLPHDDELFTLRHSLCGSLAGQRKLNLFIGWGRWANQSRQWWFSAKTMREKIMNWVRVGVSDVVDRSQDRRRKRLVRNPGSAPLAASKRPSGGTPIRFSASKYLQTSFRERASSLFCRQGRDGLRFD
jgi:hypothetical protein